MGRLAFFSRPKVYVPVLSILTVSVISLLVIRNMDAPAVGNIEQTPLSKAEVTDPYSEPGFFSGKYISFKYPAHYKKLAKVLDRNTLDSVSLHAVDISGKQVNVAVYTGSLANDSNVIYRERHPELYIDNQTKGWMEFAKKDGTEDTFFIPHNGLLASVSATSASSDQSGDGQYVASTLKWK